MNLLRRLASRGIAGICDCIILATIALLLWFLFISESEFKYFKAALSCVGFIIAYVIYYIANKIHDGV
jgi:uncharacterized membrane protein